MTAATLAPIEGKTTVNVPVEQAFTVFTESFTAWWPHQYHIGQSDVAEVILESHEGGRWYEIGVDGTECDWSRVLAWLRRVLAPRMAQRAQPSEQGRAPADIEPTGAGPDVASEHGRADGCTPVTARRCGATRAGWRPQHRRLRRAGRAFEEDVAAPDTDDITGDRVASFSAGGGDHFCRNPASTRRQVPVM